MEQQDLETAYNSLLQQATQLQMDYQNLRADRLGEQWDRLMRMIEHRESYPESIIKLVEWHLEQLLKKPKKQKSN